MDPESEPVAVEVPAGRVLRCGALGSRAVTGTMGWARGRGWESGTGSGGPYRVTLTPRLLLPQRP